MTALRFHTGGVTSDIPGLPLGVYTMWRTEEKWLMCLNISSLARITYKLSQNVCCIKIPQENKFLLQ